MSNIINIVALFFTLASFGVAFYFYRKGRKIKRLDILIGRPISILKSATRLREKLRVEYDGTKMDNPSMLRVRVTCSGNTAIRNIDLEENPLRVKIKDDRVKIYDCIKEHGKELFDIEESIGNERCRIKVKSLNPGDEFEMILFTEGDPFGAIEIIGKVIGGEIRHIDPSGVKSVQQMLNAIFKVLAFSLPLILLLYFTTGAIFKNIFSIYGTKLLSVNIAMSSIIGLLISIIIVKILLAKKRKEYSHSDLD